MVGRGGLATEMLELVVPDCISDSAGQGMSLGGFLEIHRGSDDGDVVARVFQTLDSDEKGRPFEPVPNAVFLLSSGVKGPRKTFLDYLLHYYAHTAEHFPNFVSRTARIGKTVELGIGNVITWNCMFASRSEIGDFNNFNFNCVLSHDSKVGSHNIFSPTLNSMGNVTIGDYVFTGASVTVCPGVEIGDNTTVQAGITLLESVPANSLVRRKASDIEVLAKPGR